MKAPKNLARKEWIEKAYAHLCKRLGPPENKKQEKNLRAWAVAIFHGQVEMGVWDCSPEEAVDEYLSCA